MCPCTRQEKGAELILSFFFTLRGEVTWRGKNSTSKCIWKNLWKTFVIGRKIVWSCKKIKKQCRQLGWIGSAMRTQYQESANKRGRKMHPLVAKLFAGAICQWRCPERCSLNLSDQRVPCSGGTTELNLHSCIPRGKRGKADRLAPLKLFTYQQI